MGSIRRSWFTEVDGKIVHGTAEYASLTRTFPEVSPEWTPVPLFHGYRG